MKKIFDTKVDAIGLSIFRIFFSIILFFELSQLYRFKSIMYDKESFIYIGEIDVRLLFNFWYIIILLLFLGLFTRFATIANYIFSVIIFSSASHFEYHVFYSYVGINFVLMFIPVSRVLSLDSLIQKIKYSNLGRSFVVDRKVLEINYIIPVFAAVALVYFDSIFHKLASKLWLDGLGVWLPSSLPMVTWNDTSFLLNNENLVKFLGYFVLVFEAVLIFLIWFRKPRFILFLIGVLFHIGIIISYPIPLFGLTYCLVYFLLLKPDVWIKIANFFKFKQPKYKFYYDVECPLCNKVIVIIKHFDVFNAVQCITVQGHYQDEEAFKGIDEEVLLINIHGVTKKGEVKVAFWAYVQLFKSMVYLYPLGLFISIPGISNIGERVYKFVAGNRLTERCTAENCSMPVFTNPVSEEDDILIKGFNQLSITKFFWKFVIVLFIFCQLLFIWKSPLIQNNFPKITYINKVVKPPFDKVNWYITKYLGVKSHAVFVDNHFENFNHIIKINYIDENNVAHLLPIINENGMPTGYNVAVLWRNISFNVITTNINKDKVEKGIIPYLKFYLEQNNIKIKNNKFDFYIKEIEIPTKWEYNFLKRQMAKPWFKVGSCSLNEESTSFEWNEKMKEILISEEKEK